MKKLMITVAAIATGVMAWAGSLSNVFDASTAADLTGWSGATDKAVLENNLLKIKTGGDALSRDINPAFTVTDNIYFDVSLDVLEQALDEVPAVANDAKLALFLLDGTEIDGAPTGVGLYAIAKNPAGGKMLFKLGASAEDVTRVTVKGYKNVMKSGTENAGFMVYLKGGETEGTVDPLVITAAYAMDGDNVVWTDVFNSDTYLNGAVITPLIQKRSNVLLALLSGVDGQSFAAMDFVGNANISKVEMNDEGFDFIPGDLQSAAITLDGVSITVDPAEAYLAEEGLLIANCTITATATSAAKPVIKGNANVEETADGVFSYTFVSGKDVTLTAYELAATVEIDGVLKKYTSLADALDDILSAETASVKLYKDEAITSLITSGTVTIDLNGKALTGNGGEAGAVIYAGAGALVITDSVGTGSVQGTDGAAAVLCEADATVAIDAGIFESAVADNNDPVATVITGGAFKEDPRAYVTAPYVAAEVEGYWVVTQYIPEVVDVSVIPGEGTTLTVTGYSEGKATEGDTLTITAGLEDGYKDLVVTVNGESIELDDGVAEIEVGTDDLVIASSATEMVYVAQIGETKYESIATAFAALADGETLTLLADVSADNATETLLIAANNSTLDLGGFELKVAVQKDKFGIADGKTVTLTNGTITMTSADYGFKVGTGATLNVACKMELKAGGHPVLDIYGGTVNCGDQAVMVGAADIFRFKDENLESTVNVTGGTYTSRETSTTSRWIFHHYKAGHIANITITGGTFTFGTKEGVVTSGLIDAYTQDDKASPILNFTALDSDCNAKFSSDKIFVGDVAEKANIIKAGYKAKKVDEEWYKIVAIQYATLTIANDAQVSGVVVKAGETVVSDGAQFDVDAAVEVTADVSAAKYAKGYEADADNSTLSATMTTNATIKAAAKKSTYTITVTDGTASAETYQISDDAQTIELTPGTAPEGKKFKQWNLTEKAGGSISENTLTIAADTIGNIAVEAQFEDDQKDLPGAGDVPEEQKGAYNTWAAKNGVVAGDTEAHAELATAWALGVDDISGAAAIVAKAQEIVTAQVTQALVDAIAAGNTKGALDAIATALNAKAKATVTVTLKPVELAGSTANLFKLAVTIAK